MTGFNAPLLAARMFNVPLMVDPDKAAVVLRAVGPRLLGLSSPEEISLTGHENASEPAWSPKPYASLLGDELAQALVNNPGAAYTVHEGIAVIPVVGTLVRRGRWTGQNSGMTSYEGLRAQLLAAAEDPRVKAVALEIDSFGGEANGLFELTSLIRDVRARKEVRAFLAEHALSAGYAIASQANHVTISKFGQAGSIGVVVMHTDLSGNLEKNGVKVTFIHAGAHKVEGNPYEPLPDSVREEIQKDVNARWLEFASDVEAGRNGKLKAQDALRLEAAVFTGADAVARGLADEVANARDAFLAFVSEMSSDAGHAPSAMASGQGNEIGSSGCETGGNPHHAKEGKMPDTKKQPEPKTPAKTAAVAETSAPQEELLANERQKAATITRKVAEAGLPAAMATEMIEEGISLESAYERIIDAKAARAEDGGDIRNHVAATVTGDVVDRTREGMTRALYARVGLDGGERNEFTGMTLREMARMTLQARGAPIPAGGVNQLASAAFAPGMAGGMHSGSDFGNILADVANKSMLKGFEEVDETFERFTSIGTLTDFKPTHRVGLDAFPSLEKIEDGAEFKYGTTRDHGETLVLATYGKMFAITRQTIINDDLDAFSRVPMKMGRAARRTIGDLVYAVLTGNPQMSDGVNLFHANHKNLAAAGSIPSEAAINAGITAMSTQKDRSGNGVLNVGPKYLIAPPHHRAAVLQALKSEYAPDDTSKAGTTKMSRAYNTVRDAAIPIFDARIQDTSWFLAADPGRFDTIEVAYLDGVASPFLDQQKGWSVDGTEFKVRIDAGVAALAWEGLYKDPGA